MAIDKSKWNKNIKVSQKTIDEIKKMGMTKALKTAAGAGAAGRNVGDASAKEWAEGLRRLYTPERVDKLMGSSSKATKSGPQSANTPAYGLKKPAGQYTKGPVKSSKAGSTSKPTVKPGTKMVGASGGGKGYSYSTKVSQSKDSLTFGEGVGKAAKLAGTALIAGRFPGAGRVAARAIPTITQSSVGRAVFGSKAAAKASSNLMKRPGAVSPSTMAKGIKETGDSVSVGAKGSFGKTTSAMAKGKKKIGTKSEFANKATEESVRAGLAARASRSKEGVTVGPKGSFGKTGVRKPQTPPAYKPKQSITKPPTANKKAAAKKPVVKKASFSKSTPSNLRKEIKAERARKI